MDATCNSGLVTITMNPRQARYLKAVLASVTPRRAIEAAEAHGVKSEMRTQPGQDMAVLYVRLCNVIEELGAE
jgi:hypothetical protein